MKPVRNSAKALIIKDNLLLVIKQVDEIGAWYTLPGGGQNPGETLVQALQRECLEEVGLEVEVGDLLFVREYIGKNHEFWEHDADSHQIEFIFDCSIKGDNLPRIGTSPDIGQIDVEWISLQEIMNFRLYPKALIHILVDRQPENRRYLGDVN
jgi:ADP-ribose pyrophosphatase YjhB (NUDIX family)